MERSSPYPQEADPDSLHRNGNYGLNSYSAVDTNHKNNFTESRPRSYGNEHYAGSSYPVSQTYVYGYQASYTPDPHRATHYDAMAYSESLGSLDRQEVYRPRSADPSHSYSSHYDYPSHFSPHIRPPYHDEANNFRSPREQYFPPTDTKHVLPDTKPSYSLYEEARMTFSDRSYPTSATNPPDYTSKPPEATSELHLNSGDLRSPHSLPAPLGSREVEGTPVLDTGDIKKPLESMFDLPTSLTRDTLSNIEQQNNNSLISDGDPLDLRKTENWSDGAHFPVNTTERGESSQFSVNPAERSEGSQFAVNQIENASLNSQLPAEGVSSLKPVNNQSADSRGGDLRIIKSNGELVSGGMGRLEADPLVSSGEQVGSMNNTLDSIIDEGIASEVKPLVSEETPVEPEIMGKKKKAAVEAEMKNNLEKEAKKECEIVETDEKHRSRRKSKKPMKDPENGTTVSEEADDDQTYHCGFCGEIFHDQNLLVSHDCQDEELDSDDDNDGDDDDDDEDEDEEVEKNVADENKTPTKSPSKPNNSSESESPVRRSARKNKAQVRIKDMSEEEEEPDPYICGECGQTFVKERLLLRHIKTHRNSDIEDYVEDEGSTPSRYATRSRISRPKRNATKRKSYDYDIEESYTEPDNRSKRKKHPVIKIKEPKVPAVPEDIGKYGCAICGEICVGRDAIAQHLIGHCTVIGEQDKIWDCEYCDKHFADENFLDRHNEVHELNGDQKIVKIEPVKKKEKKENTKEKKYECSTCNEIFKFKTELRVHERSHNETRKYLCVVCGEESQGKDAYLKHKKLHRTPKSYSCEECGDTFTLRGQYNQHMKSHGLKTSYDCEQCNRSFFSAGHLAIHKKGHKHAGTKKHRCQECGYQVYSEAKLMEHLESHMNQDPFMCPFCGKLFMKKSTFTKHKKKHSGQNMCDVCGKAFSHKSGLDRHYTTHSGEKSFKCMYCDKSFSQQSNLSTHLRQHSGEKPFMCEICAHSFTNKCSLVRHMTKHTEGETEMHAANLARQGAVNTLSNITLPPLPNSISHSMYALNQYQY